MATVFTPNQIEIFKGWLLKKKNEEIANEIKSTELDVSKTLKMILEKMTTLENSLNVLSQMGLIAPREEFKLTEKGEESFEESRKKFIEESKSELKNNSIAILELSAKNAIDSFLDKTGNVIIKPKHYQWGTLLENRKKSEDFDAIVHYAKALDITTPIMLGSNILPIDTIITKQKFNSELEYNTKLLSLISKRMVDSIMTSNPTNIESSVMISTINEIIHNLYQIIEWLNSPGQIQKFT